jgi:hypothetical protein
MRFFSLLLLLFIVTSSCYGTSQELNHKLNKEFDLELDYVRLPSRNPNYEPSAPPLEMFEEGDKQQQSFLENQQKLFGHLKTDKDKTQGDEILSNVIDVKEMLIQNNQLLTQNFELLQKVHQQEVQLDEIRKQLKEMAQSQKEKKTLIESAFDVCKTGTKIYAGAVSAYSTYKYGVGIATILPTSLAPPTWAILGGSLLTGIGTTYLVDKNIDNLIPYFSKK